MGVKTANTVVVPLVLRFPAGAHQNALVCQLLPSQNTVQVLHFEPHGHRSANLFGGDWVERRTKEALVYLCRRETIVTEEVPRYMRRRSNEYENRTETITLEPYKLIYFPAFQACPSLGSQRLECSLIRNLTGRYEMDGLCVMHCLNMLKKVIDHIKTHPGTLITPDQFQQITASSKNTIFKDLLARTDSLMRLGGYNNRSILRKSGVSRLTDLQKKAIAGNLIATISQKRYQSSKPTLIGRFVSWLEQ